MKIKHEGTKPQAAVQIEINLHWVNVDECFRRRHCRKLVLLEYNFRKGLRNTYMGTQNHPDSKNK